MKRAVYAKSLLAAVCFSALWLSAPLSAAPLEKPPESVSSLLAVSGRPWNTSRPDLDLIKSQALTITSPSVPAVSLPNLKAVGCAAGPVAAGEERPSPARGFYNDGIAALGRDKLDEAAFNFSEAGKADPLSPIADDSLFWLAEVRRIQGKAREAVVAFEKVKGTYAQEARYRAAVLYENLERHEEARESWSKIAGTQGSPFRDRAYFQLGLAALLAGRLPRAIENFERSLELSTPGSDTFAYASYHLAVLYREEGQLPKARKLLDSLLLSRPDHAAADPARVLSGWIELELGNSEAAERRLGGYLLLGKRAGWLDARAHYAMAKLSALAGKPGAARDELARLSSERDRIFLSWGWLDLGWTSYSGSDFAGALAAFREADKLSEKEEKCAARFMQGASLKGLGRSDEAAAAFLSVGRECASHGEAQRRAAAEWTLSGNPRKAADLLKELDKGGLAQADRDLIHRDLGQALTALGDLEGARLSYLKVSENSEAYGDALYARAALALGDGKYEEAASLLQRFKSFFPNHPGRSGAALMEARANFEKGDHQEALGLLDQIVRYAAEEAVREEALFLKGGYLELLGRGEESDAQFESLVKENPEGAHYPEALYRLGARELKAGRWAKADELARKALAKRTSEKTKAELLALRGEALYFQGGHEAVIELYRAEPGNWALAKFAALSLGRLGRLEQMALETARYLKALPDDPAAGTLLLALAGELKKAGRLPEAAERYGEAAKRLKGEEAQRALHLKAECLVLTGKLEEAEKLYGEVQAGGGPLGVEALKELAGLARKRGDPTRLLDAYLKLYKGEPLGGDRAGWARKASELLVKERRPEEAEKLLAEAAPLTVGFDRERQALLTDLGELLLARGAFEGAVTELRKAVSVGREADEPRASYLLATALFNLGQKEAALETCLRLGYHYSPENEYAARALLFAAKLHLQNGRKAQAFELLERVAREAASPHREEARKALAEAASPEAEKGAE